MKIIGTVLGEEEVRRIMNESAPKTRIFAEKWLRLTRFPRECQLRSLEVTMLSTGAVFPVTQRKLIYTDKLMTSTTDLETQGGFATVPSVLTYAELLTIRFSPDYPANVACQGRLQVFMKHPNCGYTVLDLAETSLWPSLPSIIDFGLTRALYRATKPIKAESPDGTVPELARAIADFRSIANGFRGRPYLFRDKWESAADSVFIHTNLARLLRLEEYFTQPTIWGNDNFIPDNWYKQ